VPKAEVSIVVKAYDAATRVLKVISGAVSGIAKVVKWGAIGAITGASAAVAGLTYWMIKEANAQTAAEASLRGVLMGFGQLGKQLDATMGKYRALSEAIMKETGIGDDQTLSMIAQLQQVGVLETQMEAATRAVYGLSAVGLEGDAAIRAVSNAMQGNFQMLTRYVPAIRNATTEQEKQAAVSKLAAIGYGVVGQKLTTVAGAYGALKGQAGELLEAIGMTIFKSGGLAGALLSIRDRVAAIGESEGFKKLLARIKEITIEAGALAKVLLGLGNTGGAADAWKGIGSVIVTALEYGGATLANLIYEAAVSAGRKIKEEVVGQQPSRNPNATWREKMFPMVTSIGADMGAASVAAEKFIDKIADPAGAKRRFEDAMKGVGAIVQKEVASGMGEGAKDAAPSIAENISTAIDENNTTAVLKAEKDAFEARKEAGEKYVDGLEKQDKLLADQIDKLEEIRDKNREIVKERAFGKQFDEWKQAKKEQAADDKLDEDRQRRAWKLAAKEAKRGTKLSPEDQQFLNDMRDRAKARRDARGNHVGAEAGIVAAQAARDGIQERIAKAQEALVAEQKIFNARLEKNLAAPGGG
jgi:hypothetical protein